MQQTIFFKANQVNIYVAKVHCQMTMWLWFSLRILFLQTYALEFHIFAGCQHINQEEAYPPFFR